jgi:hypothetical protein
MSAEPGAQDFEPSCTTSISVAAPAITVAAASIPVATPAIAVAAASIPVAATSKSRRRYPSSPLSTEEAAARYQREAELKRERLHRAHVKAMAQLSEAKAKAEATGEPYEIPRSIQTRRDGARRHYIEKVRPVRLAERAKKGSLLAQWELENYASLREWMAQKEKSQAIKV